MGYEEDDAGIAETLGRGEGGGDEEGGREPVDEEDYGREADGEEG